MNFETRIPVEILSEIFHLLCNEPIALHILDNSSHFEVFPWAVGQVCRRWRTAFLSHPPLWTSIALRDPLLLGHPSASYLAEMNRRSAIYLKRSGQRPITITISTSMQIPTAESPIATIWIMLLSCSNRWRKAVIMLPPAGSVIDDALLECRCRMPILESLKIYTPASESQRHHNVFEIAPHLIELDLVLYDGMIRTWMFPWAQLTKLDLEITHARTGGFASGNELRSFLLQLQNAEELRLATLQYDVAPFKFPPVHLTRLRFLEVSVGFSGVFSWIEPPLLEHLSIDYDYGSFFDTGSCREELSSLIDRSSCHIRKLTLQCGDDELARNVMNALDSVEELCIENQEIAPCLVRIIANSNICIHLPNMQALNVTICPGGFEELVAELSCLLKVRSKGSITALPSCNIVPLEKLTIRIDWGYCDGDCCQVFYDELRTLDSSLEVMSSWPSFSLIHVHSDQSKKYPMTLNARALTAGTLIDLTFYYFNTEENCRYHRILEKMCTVV